MELTLVVDKIHGVFFMNMIIVQLYLVHMRGRRIVVRNHRSVRTAQLSDNIHRPSFLILYEELAVGQLWMTRVKETCTFLETCEGL